MPTTFTTTIRQVTSFTNPITGETITFPSSFTLTGLTKSRGPEQGNSDNDGFDTLYDASQVTEPIGDADPGNAPFLFVLSLTSDSGAILKITDNNATIHFRTIPAGQSEIVAHNVVGVASTDTIEQIEIQSLTATDCEYAYLFQHD